LKTRRLLCGSLLAVPLLIAGPVASAAGGRGRVQAVTLVDTGSGPRSTSYWTPARMEFATPLDRRASDAEAGPPSGVPVARGGAGSRVVGALFFDGGGGGSHYCTASVIRTAKKNLLLTAAHCLYNPNTHEWHSHIVFVPKYSQGNRPYGTWPVWLMVVDKRWMDHGDPDLDFGFAAVQVMGGRRIADVVGSNQLLIHQDYTNKVLVTGYPAKSNYPADRPISCVTRTYREAKYQLRFDCHGFYGGTSGSPWFKTYDRRTQSGYVIGVIGGHEQGGSEEWRSYSPVFDAGIAHLIVTADNQA
jgi:V8-like Glu-specific endopeptidase